VRVGRIGGNLIRVLVWAKSAIMRAGLESLVRADARFEVATSAHHRAELMNSVRELEPNVVLMDGVDRGKFIPTAELVGALAGLEAVILLENVRRAEVLHMLRSGIRGLVSRDATPEEIASSLEGVSNGMAVMSPEILDVLVPATVDAPADDELPPSEPLTPRESLVLTLIAGGGGNKEIASRLRISEHTVKFHVSSILNKLGAATRTEAVARGYKEGLIVI
jgi:NarL family two-component system response regulator YdfI